MRVAVAVVVVSVAVGMVGEAAAECLGNGIRLPDAWPPRWPAPTGEVRRVPYLEHPPRVIAIDVGRQLFVDDFLIESTTLTRTFHRPEYHPGNPVIRPDRPWEKAAKAPFAAVFSDGVWYDPSDRLFKMWYMAGIFAGTAYATSRDGLTWTKPTLDVVEQGTNLVDRLRRDSSTVWLDWHAADPTRRWKMFTATKREGRKGWFLSVKASPDGVHWSKPLAETPGIGDRSTVFYNPFRKKWVYSIRSGGPRGRSRRYRECDDPLAGAAWEGDDCHLWSASDKADPHNPNPERAGIEPQLYNLDATPYESLMLGLFSIWQGPHNAECGKRGIHKRNEVLLGFSRDGFHWHRPDRRPFLQATETKGNWRWGNVQSAGGGCLVVGDRLHFYFSGRALCDDFWDGAASTGLATLRRDGFASMDAGPKGGALTTRPLRFGGNYLFVNANADGGEVTAEILDLDGAAIEPFTRENCRPISTDSTFQRVTWRGADTVHDVAARHVRLRFHVRRAALYAFWVAVEENGASDGYVAAGGPGFTGPADTVGRVSYTAAEALCP